MDTEKLKSTISKILNNALSGVEKKYRLERNYVRWGLVEREIRSAIDSASQPGVESDAESRAVCPLCGLAGGERIE